MQQLTNLQKFQFYTKDLESPDIYIEWNFYSIIASCLARKIWLSPGSWPIYPNLYIIFVARPGFGKSIPLIFTESILKNVVNPDNGQRLITLGADSTTFEKIAHKLKAAEREVELASGMKPGYTHASMTFLISELGVLFRDNKMVNDIITLFTDGYDCKSDYENDTITHGSIKARNICFNFVACCTTDWLGRKLGQAVMTDGWNSRTIYIYGSTKRHKKTFFTENAAQKQAQIELLKHLRKLAMLPAAGIDMEKSKEAIDFIDDWYVNKSDTHLKNSSKCLVDYYERKKVHLIKLAMVKHFCEKTTYQLDLEDAIDALAVLDRTEEQMHLCFASSESNNPVYDMADNIRRMVETSPGKSIEFLQVLEHKFEEGGLQAMEEAITWLTQTKQVVEFNHPDNGKRCLRMIERK